MQGLTLIYSLSLPNYTNELTWFVFLFGTLNAAVVVPILEELRFRQWLPRTNKQFQYSQFWFWVWVLHTLAFIIPITVSLPVIDLSYLITFPVVDVVNFFGYDPTLVSTFLYQFFGLNLQIFVLFPLAFLLSKLVKFIKKPWIPNQKVLYCVSILTFVLAHGDTVMHTVTISITRALVLVIGYILGGILLSIIYHKHGIKASMLAHGLFNLTGTLITVIVFA